MTKDDNSFLIQFDDPDSNLRLMFEDDGRTAYAYLIKGEQAVSLVWLYNHGSPPSETEWTDESRMPFRNPVGFALDTEYPPITDIREVAVAWGHGVGLPVIAEVYLRGNKHALLKVGSKPGWCKLAVKDGPLAKVLKYPS